MTFKDSSWRMSIVVAAQPHFKAQDPDTTIFWGYGLYTDHVGDYVKKPMRDCTGAEILKELLHQLHWEEHQEEIMADVVNVIPCMMPYVDAPEWENRLSYYSALLMSNANKRELQRISAGLTAALSRLAEALRTNNNGAMPFNLFNMTDKLTPYILADNSDHVSYNQPS